MTTARRVDWVDYAKGFCIIMVVMMHSTLGVEKATGTEGWMHYLVAFATPFRMPDFFLISGLFLARVIDRDWRTFLDKKLFHFAYFYLLWMGVNFATKAPGILADGGWDGLIGACLLSFIEPFGTLWFIYLLPIFFVTVKATRRIPAPILFALAALLEIAPIHTGWTVPDEFAARFIYFYAGYLFAPQIFALAARAIDNGRFATAYLVGWSLLNGTLVFVGLAALPGISLGLGFVGAVAVVIFASQLAKTAAMAPLRYLGRNSIVIYLAFFLFMAASRAVLLRLGIISDIGTISLLVTAAGVVGPILLFWSVRRSPLRFLFERPAWAHLEPQTRLVPAE